MEELCEILRIQTDLKKLKLTYEIDEDISDMIFSD
jgi:hypothetical protein